MTNDVAKMSDFQELQKQVNEQYAGIAQEISKRVTPVSASIRGDNKQFVFPTGDKVAGPISVVIVNFMNRNVYYSTPYNPNNMAPPDCYAQGEVPSQMAPPADVQMKQSDDCQSCPMNQFGSAIGGGNGKACQNQRVLAVMAPDDPSSEIMLMRVSPSANRQFDNYISKLSSMLKVPPFAVITEVSFDPDVRYDKLVFGNPRPNPRFKEYAERIDETLALLEPRFEAAPTQVQPASDKKGARR